MNKVQLFLTLLSVAIVNGVQGQPRKFTQVRQIAAEKLQCKTSNVKKVVLTSETLKGTSIPYNAANPPFFVFNSNDSNSFVIISADQRMKKVLGCCDKTYFDVNKIPCGLASMLSHYSSQYYSMGENSIATSTSAVEEEARTFSDVAPILKTKWGQGSPYNDDVPEGCPSGCVATAMAQIMKHYQYPEIGKGQFSYSSRTNGYRLSYDYDNSQFSWHEMDEKYSRSSSFQNSESSKEVANIMKACGISVGMDYTTDGSGAYDCDIPYALINYFSYSKSVALYYRDYFKSSEWYDKLLNELEAGRPVLYCGADKHNGGGHAFIIHGYRQSDGKFYVNWGWDGSYDGYYELDALDPSVYGFSSNQSMIVRFSPDIVDEIEDTFYADEFTCNGSVATDKMLKFSLDGVVNFSNSSSFVVKNSSFSGYIGVGLFDKEFKFIKTLAEKPVNGLKTTGRPIGKIQFSFCLPSNSIDSRLNYYIVPYAKSEKSGVPTRIRTIGGLTDFICLFSDEEEHHDDHDVPKTESLLTECFEGDELPEDWEQTNIMGNGKWENIKVLIGNDNSDTPTPETGHGYMRLKYDSGSIIADKRTITRLETPVLYGIEGQQYAISLLSRKYSTEVNSKEILSIMIDYGCDGNWESLCEQGISNTSTWQIIEIPFIATGPYKLGIEGSLENGSVIFVDDAKVFRTMGTDLRLVSKSQRGSKEYYYSICGWKKSGVQKGINVIRNSDGNIRKIISR